MKRVLILYTILTTLLIGCNNNQHISYREDDTIPDSLIKLNNNNIKILIDLSNQFEQQNNTNGLLKIYDQLGKVYRDSSQFLESIKYLSKLENLAIQKKDTIKLIQAYNNIATNFRRMGILYDASSFHYKALSLCEDFSDKESQISKKNKVITLNGLGNIYLSLNDYEVADSIFRLALIGEKELQSYLGQAINYANLGAIFEAQNKPDSAWVYYKHSMDCNQKANSNLGICLCYKHFGRLLENSNKLNQAIEQYKNSYNLMLNNSDSWHWLGSCIALTRLYLKLNDINNAEKYLNKAEKTAISIKSLNHISDVYYYKYKIAQLNGDYKQSLNYYEKSNAYRDSATNSKDLNNMENIRIKYEKQKNKRKIDFIEQSYHNEKKFKKATITISILLIITSILIIAFLGYLLNLRRRSAIFMQKMEVMRTNFFTNITHEFRTPLTVILGLGKKISNGEITNQEEIAQTGTIITRQGTNLLTLINQLLDISKIKSAIGEPDWQRGNIIGYLEMLIENTQEAALQKKIELTFVPQQNEVEMSFVPDYINKTINNLISNAIKFTPEHGKIYVLASVANNTLILNIADTGKGIDPNELEHIFDAFYRAKNSQKEIGTGVGLSLVQQLIKAMHGNITVKSNIGMGTIFTITLPIQNNEKHKLFTEREYTPEEYIPTEISDLELPTGKETNETTPLILVIEDNTDVAFYIGSQLKDKYNIFYAKNGEEGIEKAKDIMPDIIITDVMMPIMDGYQVCQQIRSSEITNHIPIIMVTARSTEQDRIKGIEAGADAYLYKPFNSTELNIRITKLLDSRNTLREKYSKALQNGNVEDIDISNQDQTFLNKFTDLTYSLMDKGGNINIEKIASKMFMTSRQLSRKIITLTGETTTTYITQIRLSKAKRILDLPDNKSIQEVAFQCGFEDCSYFTRIFKQMYGLTPTQYKKRVK